MNRPVSAFNVPTTIRDPGPDGVLGNGDDGPQHCGVQPESGESRDAGRQLPAQHAGQGRLLHARAQREQAFESAIGRSTGRTAYRWNYDNANGYFGQNLRVRQDVANPNDMINTDNGRYNFASWAAKAHGTYEAPWDLRITPALRMQAGQPFGRTIQVTLNYGAQRILTEPISSRRQDNIILLDTRVEKVIKVGGGRSVSVFADGFNLTNANPASNINWGSGGDVPAADRRSSRRGSPASARSSNGERQRSRDCGPGTGSVEPSIPAASLG